MPQSSGSTTTSSSAASNNLNGGRVISCHLCEFQCTPINALPGYQDQQLLPLPPVPGRERGRSRGQRDRGQKFCGSPVILSTPGGNNSSNSSLATSNSLSQRWRPLRRRSASTRQRQGASLIREAAFVPDVTVQVDDNCPLCQPRYSRSPARLARRPSQQPQKHEVSRKLSIDQHGLSKRKPSTLLRLDSGHKGGRRSRSEFRPLKLNDENVNPLNLHPNYRRVSRDMNGNDHANSDYAEVSLGEASKNKRASRSKSRSRGQQASGLMTIWPGKTGIWLPQ